MKLIDLPNYLLSIPITLYGKIDTSFEGERNFESEKTLMCRLEKYDRERYSKVGDSNDYQWLAYIKGDAKIQTDSKCKVNNTEYTVKNIDRHLNPDGTIHHTKLYLL